MKVLVLFGIAALFLSSGLASPEWAPKEFPIGFWCGPPDPYITVERYRQVADAGFTFLMPPCEGASTAERNRRILEAAKAVKLKAFLQDDRMPLAISGAADATQRLDAIVADYAKHPSFGGYFVFDEPGAHRFEGLAEVVAYLRKKDPAHPAYINLYPNYVKASDLGTETYEEHVRQFVKSVRPFVLSYDHYHFLKDRDRPGFFANLDLIRRLSQEAGIPFWQIVLAIPHGDYRPLNEAEKRFEAMQTLAWGGKGVLYFTYWTPGDSSFQWGPAIITHDGAPTPQYEEVKRINRDVQAIGRYLLNSVPVTVFMNGVPAPETKPREPGTPVAFPGGGDVTAGLYRADTHMYVLFANRDYKQRTSCDALLSVASNTPHRLDKATGRWLDVKGEKSIDGDLRVKLDLAPGDGELYRW